MPEGFLTDIDHEILQKVIDRAKKTKTGDFGEDGELTKAFASYVGQLVCYATGEDTIWSKPEALLTRANASWALAATREPEGDNVSLRIEAGKDWNGKRLVLDIVTDDKPFLVDSISAALSEAGKPLSFFSNAVIDITRDDQGARISDDISGGQTMRESMIHAEMDPPVAEDEIDAMREDIQCVLDDVAIAVADWEPMRARLASCIAQFEKSRLPGVKKEDQKETIEFLKWLWDNRFAFLGVRRFNSATSGDDLTLVHDKAEDLGVLKDPNRAFLKSTFLPSGELSPPAEAFLRSNEPLIVAKSNTKSFVHRRVQMDYVGVKTYSLDGSVTGEQWFIGLFTADAYNRPATDIPLIRAKVQAVVDTVAFHPGGHNEKALVNILETYPRNELFQIDIDALREVSLGILRLFKRPRAKLFLRRDRFDRFISALVFIPRDRFNSDTREAIGQLLANTYGGHIMSFAPFFGDATLVRVHFIISIGPGAPEGPGVGELTLQIREICRDWSDDLLEAMRSAHDGVTPAALFQKYEKAFGAGYKERSELGETLQDIACLEALDEQPYVLRAYRFENDPNEVVRLKIYRRDGPLPLSKLIPTIENLGLNVIQEAGYRVAAETDGDMWIHDFHTEQHKNQSIDLNEVKQAFEDTMLAVLERRSEDDRFNALVLTAGINWREAWILRAAAKHHVQAGFAYSQAYMEDALSNNPAIARDLIAAFHARFNPAGARDAGKRKLDTQKADNVVLESLNDVESLADDRIFRRFLNLFSAITRTNYYQKADGQNPKPYISFKIDSHKLDELPDPRPYREIFVSGPVVDGVHLRFGAVARGGLRWSDRREDFRTEVLGLVKAQKVKNAVIVPTGSKGGFYPKQLPQAGDRTAIFEAGREAYKLFIRGLLDLTDNIVQGKIKPPADTVLWDEPDPYLVVAADKGTAQFSDTANAISDEYGFWLGDAFASGGSVGYDHKVMGITARGAWEAVKRHFRELGKDIQTEPFTAAGVGDMSGDVFGNGMLLSKQTKLIAAFDHRDIFIDPDPNPAKSYAERARLFDLPRSSWQDYDGKLISKGGGVFSRSAKSISLTPEIKSLLGVAADKLTPNELITAILKAPVELFWLGGIGTYFKAEGEENWRVGDRANDAVRINASQSGAKVIGEGANLGLTQLARIEFAHAGGCINTDAIDNSAGVDSSDHEVNIKILLSSAIEHGELKPEDRNDLLASMTDDVADYVLRHNYEQTCAVSQIAATATADLEIHARLMTTLERNGRLNRALEYLPAQDDIITLRQQQAGLTRPEISVVLAYAKLWLFDELLESNAPDDPAFEAELFAYFPEALHHFATPVTSHQLRREIIATRLSNEIVNSCGITFVQRVVEATSLDFSAVALAYETARRIYKLDNFAAAINALDNKAPAKMQIALYIEVSTLLRGQVFQLLSAHRSQGVAHGLSIEEAAAKYQAPVAQFRKALPEILTTEATKALEERIDYWVSEGASKTVARQAAALPAMEYALDIIDLAEDTGWSNPSAGCVYFAVGRSFGFDALREKARNTPPVDHYDNIAIRQITEDLAAKQRTLTKSIIAFTHSEPKSAPAEWAHKLLAQWEETFDAAASQFHDVSAELDLSGPVSVGKFALFARKVDELIAQTQA